MKPKGARLKAKQARAITALLSEPSIKAAADSTGIGLRTLKRWLAEDTEFKAELEAAEREVVATAARQIATAGNEAITTLRGVLRDTEAGQSTRTSAARAILQNLAPIRLLGSIEQKIQELATDDIES